MRHPIAIYQGSLYEYVIITYSNIIGHRSILRFMGNTIFQLEDVSPVQMCYSQLTVNMFAVKRPIAHSINWFCGTLAW